MALKKSVVTTQGFNVPDAYHRVEQVEVMGKDNMVATVRSYKNTMLPCFSEFRVSLAHNLDGGNVFVQAYTQLKDSDRFADAEDC